MKHCPKCKFNLPISDFGPNKTRKDGRQVYCINCRRIYVNNLYQKSPDKKRQVIKKWNQKNKAQVTKFIAEYLKVNHCVDCQESDPIVLEFDHIQSSKRFNIGNALRGMYSLKSVTEEIKKCHVRCANCHRRKTYKERNLIHRGIS